MPRLILGCQDSLERRECPPGTSRIWSWYRSICFRECCTLREPKRANADNYPSYQVSWPVPSMRLQGVDRKGPASRGHRISAGVAVGKDSLDWPKIFASAKTGRLTNFRRARIGRLTVQSAAYLKTLNARQRLSVRHLLQAVSASIPLARGAGKIGTELLGYNARNLETT
jgi:hypothetical protein